MIKRGVPDASRAETVDDGYLTDGSRLNSLINGSPAASGSPINRDHR
jgi:hypothetical protein